MTWLAERLTNAPTVIAPRDVPGEPTRCELLSTKFVVNAVAFEPSEFEPPEAQASNEEAGSPLPLVIVIVHVPAFVAVLKSMKMSAWSFDGSESRLSSRASQSRTEESESCPFCRLKPVVLKLRGPSIVPSGSFTVTLYLPELLVPRAL